MDDFERYMREKAARQALERGLTAPAGSEWRLVKPAPPPKDEDDFSRYAREKKQADLPDGDWVLRATPRTPAATPVQPLSGQGSLMPRTWQAADFGLEPQTLSQRWDDEDPEFTLLADKKMSAAEQRAAKRAEQRKKQAAEEERRRKEHSQNQQPSNTQRHQDGQARRGRDQGGEKKDPRRRYVPFGPEVYLPGPLWQGNLRRFLPRPDGSWDDDEWI